MPAVSPLPLVLTVRQPWATLIVRGGKNVENRSWSPPAALQGQPVLIHAAGRPAAEPAWRTAEAMYGRPLADVDDFPTGVILGAVTVTGHHPAAGCHRAGTYTCSRWALPATVHWTLANPRPLPAPIRCRGALGLWRLPQHLCTELVEAITGEPLEVAS